jgi:hypothetical protein
MRRKEAFFMPTGPITYGVKFFSVLFAKRRKGGRAVVVKTWENKILFLSYRTVLVLSALLRRVEEEVQLIDLAA